MNNIPASYDYINASVSQESPSTVHVTNTGLQRFFARYLLQKAISVFEWQLPKTWNRDYFLYTLYCWGFLAIVKTDKFGVIPQGCSLSGYDVFYAPTHANIANPLLRGIIRPRIGTQCTLFKLQPDYCSILDLVNYYADMMALCSETAATNLLNSKLAYVFLAKDKRAAESYKKMYDAVASGDPAVVIDKSLYSDTSDAWRTFAQNLSSNYIASDILEDLRKWENKFSTEIGIPNANTEKKERLITSEVTANNFETMSKCELWLESLKKSCEEANEMFDIEIGVDWRKELQTNEGNYIDIRDVQNRPNNI